MLTLEKPNATRSPELPDTPAKPPKLLDRMREAIRVRRYSLATERNYPRAAIEWAWQYVFAAPGYSTCPRTGAYRRHHWCERNIQRAVKAAARIPRL